MTEARWVLWKIMKTLLQTIWKFMIYEPMELKKLFNKSFGDETGLALERYRYWRSLTIGGFILFVYSLTPSPWNVIPEKVLVYIQLLPFALCLIPLFGKITFAGLELCDPASGNRERELLGERLELRLRLNRIEKAAAEIQIKTKPSESISPDELKNFLLDINHLSRD